MNKDSATKLFAFAHKVAADYSRKDRQNNFNAEDFFVHKITVLSDTTAAVFYFKEPTKKYAVAFMYWTAGGGGRWNYFFPTDSHVNGMANFKDKLLAVEQKNFPLNFIEEAPPAAVEPEGNPLADDPWQGMLPNDDQMEG